MRKYGIMPRLLIVKTSSLGDVIHNLPVVSDIRLHYPDMEIDWVVEEGFADIPHLHPAIHQVIPVAIRRWRKHLFSRKSWGEICTFKQQLKSHAYETVIDTQGLLKSACIATTAIGTSHGYDKQSAREPLASFFYKQTHKVAREQHAVARNRALVAQALGYPIPDTPPDYGLGNLSITPSTAIEGSYVIGLHATSRDSKLWPVASWQNLAAALAALNIKLLLPWGNAVEEARAQEIARNHPNCTVLPKLSIASLAALICRAKAAVGVDTGLMHLAVALNTPSIAIYTDTNPELTGVYPGASCKAVSLGGCNQTTTADEVVQHLHQIAFN